MSRSQFQGDQLVNEAALSVTGKAARTQQKDINAGFDQSLNSPLRMRSSSPADEILNFEPQQLQFADGTGRSIPPINSQIPAIAASTINFQTGATTGATFDGLTFPATTVGQFRRVGFTLLANGQIKALWSDEAASVGALANAGTLFVKTGLPIGFIDLEATGATAFKTAGSATAVVENSVGGTSRIITFGSGGGTGGGSGDTTDLQSRFDDFHDNSMYALATSSVFAQEENAKVEAFSSAVYDPVNGAYSIGVGETVETIDLIDHAEFAKDVSKIDLAVAWDISAIDLNAQYYISRHKGGTSYQEIAMSRVGETDMFVGSLELEDARETNNINRAGGLTTVEKFDNSSNQALSTEAILPFDSDTVDEFSPRLVRAGFSALAGNYRIKILGDNSGPDTSNVIFTGEWIPVTNIPETIDRIVHTLDVGGLIVGGTYHFAIETDDDYKANQDGTSNYIAWEHANASPWGNAFNGSVWSATTNHYDAFILCSNTDYDPLYSQLTQNQEITLDTTTKQKLASKVVVTSPSIVQQFGVFLRRVGTPVGSYTVSIQTGVSEPSGEKLIIYKDSLANMSTAAIDQIRHLVDDTYLATGTYWVVFEYEATVFDGSNYFNVGIDSAGGDANECLVYNGSAWVTTGVAGGQASFRLWGRPLDLTLKVVGGTADSLLKGFEILYDYEFSPVIGERSAQTFTFDSTNQNQFVVTNFTVNPDSLVVYEKETGQAYVWPAFEVQGNKIVFPVDTFNEAREYTLIARQFYGGFDNSDSNAALLAENHFGSLDPTFDKSQAGRGFLQRGIDGKMYEAVIKIEGGVPVGWNFYLVEA